MDIFLNQEERAFAGQMREFFTTEIPADIRERMARGQHASKDDTVTAHRIMNAHGLAVPHWPSEWGGRDWTPMQRHLWSEEMQFAHVPPPQGFNTQLVGPVIAAVGSQELKDRFLAKTANLDIWWAQGFSEPNAGSDLASLKTSAVRDGNEYVVNGQKTWTTAAQHADWIFMLVRTDPEAKKQKGLSFMLIDLKTPGVTVRPIHLIDGGYDVNEVFFEDVRVPAENLVGEENAGWDYAKSLLGSERTLNAGVALTKAKIRRVKRLAAETMVDRRPVLEDPLFRARLTKLEVEVTALGMSVLRVLDTEKKLGPGQLDPVSSLLKLKGSELQQDAAALLADVLGPSALAYREKPDVPDGFDPLPEGAVDAFPTYFNSRKFSIFSGSNEIQRAIIAKQILKL